MPAVACAAVFGSLRRDVPTGWEFAIAWIAASIMAGTVWQMLGAPALFLFTCACALLAAVYFLWQVEE